MALGYEAVYELRDLPKAVRPKIHPDAAAAPSVALVVIWPRRIIRAAGGIRLTLVRSAAFSSSSPAAGDLLSALKTCKCTSLIFPRCCTCRTHGDCDYDFLILQRKIIRTPLRFARHVVSLQDRNVDQRFRQITN